MPDVRPQFEVQALLTPNVPFAAEWNRRMTRSLLARALFLVVAASSVAWLVLRGASGASGLAFTMLGLPALLLRLPQDQRQPTELTAWHGLAILVGIAGFALAIGAYVHFLNQTGLSYSSPSTPTVLTKGFLALGAWGVVMISTFHRVRHLASKTAA
jgi:hypothetical protein